MTISQRLLTLTPGSDGWDVFNKARAMAQAGQPVIELTIGEHDIPTDPSILDAMDRAARAGHLGYAAVPGTDALRDTIAQRVTERTGVKTRRDNVVVTAGGQAALLAAHALACDPGDTALYIDPFYATYPGTLRAVGAVAHAVPAQADQGFQPDATTLTEAALATKAKSLLVNTPHNPTGVVYTADTIAGIARVAQEQNLWLISDEVYDSQVWTGTHLSPRALPGMTDRTLVIGSMSKSHAMTGSRVGWVIGPEEAVAHLINLSTHTTYGIPGYIQDAAHFALTQGAALEDKIAAPFRRRRDLTMALVAGSNRVRAVPADGAMYVMLDIRATGLSGIDFAEGLLASEKIGVMPGESFGAAAAGHVRVALTVDDKKLEYALKRLMTYAEEIDHGTG